LKKTKLIRSFFTANRSDWSDVKINEK
jgi:hypothetical protein